MHFYLTDIFFPWLFSQSSQQDAVKQKEELRKEVGCLKTDLHQVRDDRDHQLSLVQGLSVELASFKELTGKTSKELDTIMATTTALEVILLFILHIHVLGYL